MSGPPHIKEGRVRASAPSGLPGVNSPAADLPGGKSPAEDSPAGVRVSPARSRGWQAPSSRPVKPHWIAATNSVSGRT